MRRRASSSLLLLGALALGTACPAPVPPAASATSSVAAVRSCEFFGTRFAAPSDWKVEEHREAGEPIGRVSLDGRLGTHHILVSIIPRALRASADPTPASQAQSYFQSLRAGVPDWTDVQETRFEAPARSYPVMLGRALVRGPLPPLDTDQHNTVLLYFPDDFPRGRYFYVFFWTDIHAVGAQPESLDGLRSLVDSFVIDASPLGAPTTGCSGR